MVKCVGRLGSCRGAGAAAAAEGSGGGEEARLGLAVVVSSKGRHLNSFL